MDGDGTDEPPASPAAPAQHPVGSYAAPQSFRAIRRTPGQGFCRTAREEGKGMKGLVVLMIALLLGSSVYNWWEIRGLRQEIVRLEKKVDESQSGGLTD